MHYKTADHFGELAGALLKEGVQLSFQAGGRSMSPFIQDKETVIIEPPSRTLRVGDVILFKTERNQLIFHRIVGKKRDGYLTRGDAASHPDGIVPHRAVLGRAVRVVGGLNFHLWFPLGAIVAHALKLRRHTALFTMLRIPGNLLLRRLRLRDNPQ
ncbi:MAG: S24/S26 family peptidase [Nitrospirae bacterium]|nr:S24/S26 family peptidase [Nitrospirota bacterium]